MADVYGPASPLVNVSFYIETCFIVYSICTELEKKLKTSRLLLID